MRAVTADYGQDEEDETAFIVDFAPADEYAFWRLLGLVYMPFQPRLRRRYLRALAGTALIELRQVLAGAGLVSTGWVRRLGLPDGYSVAFSSLGESLEAFQRTQEPRNGGLPFSSAVGLEVLLPLVIRAHRRSVGLGRVLIQLTRLGLASRHPSLRDALNMTFLLQGEEAKLDQAEYERLRRVFPTLAERDRPRAEAALNEEDPVRRFLRFGPAAVFDGVLDLQLGARERNLTNGPLWRVAPLAAAVQVGTAPETCWPLQHEDKLLRIPGAQEVTTILRMARWFEDWAVANRPATAKSAFLHADQRLPGLGQYEPLAPVLRPVEVSEKAHIRATASRAGE